MNKIWFKSKKYGWGWYPSTWQGWVVTLLYIAYVGSRAILVEQMFDTTSSFLWRYLFELILPTGALLTVCYIKGEKPRWRWGK